MHKQPPKLEWRFSENDVEWERLQALLPPGITPAIRRRLQVKHSLWTVAMSVLLLTGAGGWWRYTTQASLQAAAAELRTTVEQKPLGVVTPDGGQSLTIRRNYREADSGEQHKQEASSLRVAAQSVSSATGLSVALQTVEIQAGQAVVQVVLRTGNGTPMYRETRFYQYTNLFGWRQTLPDATHWGEERTLVTPYFVYQFRQRDAAVVAAVAPQMDALYTTLWRNFGLPIDPTREKLIINVRVTQPPGRATVFDAAQQLSVTSPAVYLAPVALTDGELLAQAIALPLIEQVLAQAREQHALAESWRPLLNGLRLWQVWDLDLPLAVWHEDVVTWVYVALPTSRAGQVVALPERYTALCAAHKLWLPSPTEIKLPLACGEVAWEDFLLSPWGWYDPLTRLEQLVVPLRPGEYLEEPDSLRRAPHPGETVALATLIEYAVATYGRDRLPALVAGLGQYDRWETLIPAVYGVSAAEFEADWQAYLTAHYGVVEKHS